MFRFTLKNIWAYKTRLALSMLSIILGVAFLSGTLVFSSTIKGAFDDLFASVYKKTDAIVRSTETQRSDDGFSELRSSIPRSVLQEVQAIEGVKSAQGSVDIENVTVIGKDGKRVFPINGPPTFGFSQSDNIDLALFHVVDKDGKSLSLKDSVAAKLADDEIYVDKSSADIKKLKVGDTLKVVLPDAVRDYRIKGFVRFGTADGIGGPAVFLFNEKQAQAIAGKGDTFSSVEVAAQEGVSQEELKRNIEEHFSQKGKIDKSSTSKFEVVTGEELTEEAQNDARAFLDIYTYILLGFAIVSFLVALVIIINSFAIVVAQRKREYALLRAIGAKASQIRRSVFIESICVGFLASGVGIATGIGLAVGISSFMEAQGIRLPAGGLVVPSSAVILGMLVGTLATLGSALIPAWIASRVPPIEALRESAYEQSRKWIWRIIFISILGILAALTIWAAFDGSSDNRVKTMGIGIFFVFVFAIAALPLLARPFTAIVGSRPMGVLLIPFGGRHAFGVTGDIARRNNYRNPRRTGRTALALMIGVFLVVFITVLASSVTATFDKYFSENFAGDLIIGDFGATQSLTPERCASINSLDIVEAGSCFTTISPTQVDTASPTGGSKTTTVSVVDSKALASIFITPYDGNISNIGPSGMVTSQESADDKGLSIGDKIELTGKRGSRTFTITGILKEPIFGDAGFIIDYEGAAVIEEPKPAFISILTIKSGITAEEGKAEVEKLLTNTGIEITDQKSLRDNQVAQLNGVVNVIYGLLGLAIIIAAIGILNTMSLSILERRRELGLMRAIGTSKAQVRGFVRFESVIVAVMGTVVGIVVGITASFLLIKSLKDEGFDSFAVDPTRLLVIVALSAIIGVIAGAWPAWRATKVDVLKAVTVE
ncbi:MAG TPA: ABC transporter permease [Acidimicrobiia bacterium]|nr:ABC transporter permease [Acidimicrobiia bacterium]